MDGTYSILKYNGKRLRFAVDEYFPLRPDFRHEFQFVGRCPKTKKAKGLIVNEFDGTIILPYLKKKYVGQKGLVEFSKQFYLDKVRTRHLTAKISELEAKRLNTHLRKVSLKAIVDGETLLKSNRRAVKKFTDFELEFTIEFYLSNKHRLYHPQSDNILCTYTDTIPTGLDFKTTNFNDTSRFKSFSHCYLFHDLIEHKGIPLDDLAQVDFIWIDYKFLLQNKMKGLMR